MPSGPVSSVPWLDTVASMPAPAWPPTAGLIRSLSDAGRASSQSCRAVTRTQAGADHGHQREGKPHGHRREQVESSWGSTPTERRIPPP